MFPVIHGIASGGGAVATYATILRDTYSASEIFPLVDIASGTTINAFINSNRNGTLTGWDLQNAAGPVTGTLAPYSDGVSDYGNIYTSGGGVGLDDIFNGSVGAAVIWVNATDWGATTGIDMMLALAADTNNNIQIRKENAANRIFYQYKAGGTIISHTENGVSGGWHMLGMSWDTGSDEVKVFLDAGALATYNGLGTWAGNLSSSQALIGAWDTAPTFIFDGHLAYCAVKFGAVWTPADIANIYNAAAASGAD